MTIQPENKRQKTKTSNHQLQRFTQVKELLAQSKSHREISKLLHMSRVTVKKYELYDELPTIHCQSSTGIEKHLEYIESRIIQEPTILLKTLHFELKNRGYTGAYNTLSDSLKRFQISIGKAARNKVILPSNLVF
ncbi:hypothetical protein HX045_15975 [Myroides odoratimimus]|uniref:Uncharacterized protein n=3 Tax=Flavobacteriaceae TaxID=49546 RepID=A0AAI8G668_9FLAO|nr:MULTISPECIES: hypothetical protein [Myroides]APA93660.1 hypothetical protein BK054_15790 [Myroides sp. ZB35]ALU28007.1 hypothetical protein AS202_18450 [Myroides odoratimimus]EHO08177.1 hypothetical protein HMPREF9714_02200 [Myroides odoratimimus CCUG 12901]EHO10233.1 hypothetical protein HMPREF9712_01338 [Myroides odoratimimus CCUG 10230]EKB05985.1 hypothetical protein HMPREF9711_00954 [Myroides odoratimimus CCUG 3837]